MWIPKIFKSKPWYPSCNIYNQECKLIIPKGYIRCFQCEGTGCHIYITNYKREYILATACGQCNGYGYIDWVQDIKKIYKCEYVIKQISFRCKKPSCKVIKKWAKMKKS